MAMEENLKKLLRRLRSSEKKARDKGFKDAEGKLEEVYRILEQDESLLKKALAKVDFSDRNALAGFVHFLMWLQVNHKREYVETILRRITELPLPEGHSVEKAKKYKASLYYLLASYLSEDKNRLEESDQYYQKSLEQEPDFFHVQEEYASLLFRLGKFGDSVFHYKKALKLKKDSISTRLGYVLTLTLMGKFRCARKEYRLTARIAKRKNLLRSFLDDFEWMERGFIDIE
ncbi:MAG: hypothetical protein U9Q76_09535, partial [candidate division WOR-3 bacterium]|nr:hypothetical protein [candidate division WOR-3 bacterium]